jgi:hypothetical protein
VTSDGPEQGGRSTQKIELGPGFEAAIWLLVAHVVLIGCAVCLRTKDVYLVVILLLLPFWVYGPLIAGSPSLPRPTAAESVSQPKPVGTARPILRTLAGGLLLAISVSTWLVLNEQQRIRFPSLLAAADNLAALLLYLGLWPVQTAARDPSIFGIPELTLKIISMQYYISITCLLIVISNKMSSPRRDDSSFFYVIFAMLFFYGVFFNNNLLYAFSFEAIGAIYNNESISDVVFVRSTIVVSFSVLLGVLMRIAFERITRSRV